MKFDELSPEKQQQVLTLLKEMQDGIDSLAEIPFGEIRIGEFRDGYFSILEKDFELSYDEIEHTISINFPHRATLNFDVLEWFTKGLPATSTAKNLLLHQDNGQTTFGTFRVTLDEFFAYKRPTFVNIFTKSGPLDEKAIVGEKTRSYMGIVCMIPTKKWALATPTSPGSCVAETKHAFEFPSKAGYANDNVFILFELDDLEQSLAIAREVKPGENITLLVISTNPDEKYLTNN